MRMSPSADKGRRSTGAESRSLPAQAGSAAWALLSLLALPLAIWQVATAGKDIAAAGKDIAAAGNHVGNSITGAGDNIAAAVREGASTDAAGFHH